WLVRYRGSLAGWTNWAKRSLVLVAVFVTVEALWAAAALALLPPELARDTLWPAYMRQDYLSDRIHPGSLWHFMQIMPAHLFVGIVASASGLVVLVRDRDAVPAPSPFGLWIGPFFYLLGCFGYLGHGFLFYQYAWVLAPAAAWGLAQWRLRGQVLIGVLLAFSLGYMVKVTFVDRDNSFFTTNTLPDRESLDMQPGKACAFATPVDVAGEANAKPGRFVVLALDWRGGGFHYFYNPNYGLRNHLVGCAAFRPYDEAELIVKLDRVDALILEMKAGDPLRGNLEGK